MSDCSHQLHIANFAQNDIVTFPIIRLVGRLDLQQSKKNTTDPVITIIEYNATKTVPLKNHRFKTLIELKEGKNQLKIQYCCEIFILQLHYRSKTTEYTVMPLYVICDGHDGHFQAPMTERNDIQSASKRILLAAKLLQCFTAEKMMLHKFGRNTFQLENHCHLFYSKLNYLEARELSQEDLWKRIGYEITSSEIYSPKRKYLAFLSCTNYKGDEYKDSMTHYEDLLKITEGYVALGGGGLALFGTASLYTWPESFEEIETRFNDSTSVNKRLFLDDSCYRGTHSCCFSTTLGSVLHELYHSFDLGHTTDGIMGRGFDDLKNFFFCDTSENPFDNNNKISKDLLNDGGTLTKSSAAILGYHRWINDKKTNTSYSLTYNSSNLLIRSTNGIRVVEIRTEPNELVSEFWTFESKVLKYCFKIPDDVLSNDTKKHVFVEDNCGNILKRKIK